MLVTKLELKTIPGGIVKRHSREKSIWEGAEQRKILTQSEKWYAFYIRKAEAQTEYNVCKIREWTLMGCVGKSLKTLFLFFSKKYKIMSKDN